MTLYQHDNARLARDYDRLGESQLEAGKRLFERMQLHAGAKVLDVGCGTGRLAEWIATHVAPGGQVVGIDPLPDRIAIARERAPGLRFEIGYAEDLAAFPDDTFDGVCMSAVFHWVPDKPKALAESLRVLRPGGRLGLTTTPKELHAAGTMAALFAAVFAKPTYRGRIHIEKFALARQSVTVTEVITMLLEAGLRLSELHVLERVHHKANANEMLDFAEASSFGNLMSAIPADLHACFRSDFEQAAAACCGPDGLRTRDYGMLVVAHKPAAP